MLLKIVDSFSKYISGIFFLYLLKIILKGGNWYIVLWLRCVVFIIRKKLFCDSEETKFLLSDVQRQLVRSNMASEGGRI